MSATQTLRKNSVKEEKIAIVWENLLFQTSSFTGNETKTILNNIDGYVKFGCLAGLMGPSGSGKSTFLKCLNGQHKQIFRTQSKLYVNRTREILSCFIAQDVRDHLMYGLTVKESLYYASRLKNSTLDYKVNHKTIVKKMLDRLMLKNSSDTLVKNCSGGEQKRIAIAAELTAIKMPNLLCIDEPTSGLDSNAAEIVIDCLKKITQVSNVAVLVSIHQPNAEVLLMFDEVYVLSSGGKCVFFDKPANIGQHLIDCGITIGDYKIPIQILIQYAAKGNENAVTKTLIHKAEQSTANSVSSYKKLCELTKNGIEFENNNISPACVGLLIGRTFRNTMRVNVLPLVGNLVVCVAAAFILSYLGNTDIGKPDACLPADAANITAAYCAESLNAEWLVSQNLIFQFIQVGLMQFIELVVSSISIASDIKIFYNEHRNGWYSTGDYYWAKTVAKMPSPLLATTVFCTIIYVTTNQIWDAYRLTGVILANNAAILCTQGLGFFFGILIEDNLGFATTISIVVWFVQIFFADFFVGLRDIHRWLQYASHFSYLKQAYQTGTLFIYGLDRCPLGQSWVVRQLYVDADTRVEIAMNGTFIVVHLFVVRLVTFALLRRKANR